MTTAVGATRFTSWLPQRRRTPRFVPPVPLRLRTRHQLAPLLAGALSAAALLPAPAEARLTPAGWRLDPAGAEFGVPGDQVGFRGPEGAALSPDGRFLLASSSGPGRYQTVDLLDLRSRRRVDHVTYDSQKDTTGRSAFYGVAFSPDGRQAWASGGGQQVVHSYTVLPEGKLQAGPDIEAPWFPAGLAYGPTPLGPRLYVANNLSGPPSVAGNPTGDSVSVIDPAAPPGTAPARVKLGSPHEPLDVALNRQGTRA